MSGCWARQAGCQWKSVAPGTDPPRWPTESPRCSCGWGPRSSRPLPSASRRRADCNRPGAAIGERNLPPHLFGETPNRATGTVALPFSEYIFARATACMPGQRLSPEGTSDVRRSGRTEKIQERLLVWCLRNNYTFAAMDFGRRLGASDEHIPKWICKERATTPPPKRHAALRVALKLAWGFVAQSVEYHCGYTPSFARRPRPI